MPFPGRLRAWLLLVCGWVSCACPSLLAPDAGPSLERQGLKVPLPDGWKAAPGAGGLLLAGPAGRTVLELESSSRPLPTAAALLEALGAQDVYVVEEVESGDFVQVRYRLATDGGGEEAFLGVRRTGRLTVWCASVAGASPGEVQEAAGVCARLGQD
ncbi:MAG: hypothetical protein IT380_20345 [Myxococcales bacterium]|nr:hypothetical protein [Myxococcales bacterium]